MAVARHSDRRRWTAADLYAIPEDGKRYEIIDGELFVSPPPAPVHQRLVARFLLLLHPYLEDNRLGEVLPSPADIEFADDTVVQPDVFVLPTSAGNIAPRWEDIGRLLLAVEILSPSSARADRIIKRERYQRAGIPEYWIVDSDARVIERWRPNDERPEILDERLNWRPDPALPPLSIDLPALFAAAIGG